ncbi:MAG: hypothetical protein P1V97_29510, partial [Planctomycetota bacterium]|nr:hypothetical protein [Planctomycetota bacterium]
MTSKLWRTIALTTLLGLSVACVTPRKDPRKKSAKKGAVSATPLKAPTVITWSEEDTELATA